MLSDQAPSLCESAVVECLALECLMLPVLAHRAISAVVGRITAAVVELSVFNFCFAETIIVEPFLPSNVIVAPT